MSEVNEMIYYLEFGYYKNFLNNKQQEFFENINLGKRLSAMEGKEKKFNVMNHETNINIKTNNDELKEKLRKYFALTNEIELKEILNCDWYIDIKINSDFEIPKYLFEKSQKHFLEHEEIANLNLREEGIYIWKENEFWLVRKENKIFVESNDEAVAYELIRKMVRQIQTKELENSQGFRLHSSACSINNLGVAFLGDKGAGKTTLLLSFLAFSKAKYITNDLLEVRYISSNSRFSVKGWPTVCLVGKGTLEAIDKYSYLMNQCNQNKHQKYEIEFKNIEKQLDTEIVSESSLDIIIFPKLNLEEKESYIKQLTYDEGIKMFDEYIIKEDIDHPDWLLLGDNQKNINEVEFEAIKKLKYYTMDIGCDLDKSIKVINNLLGEF